MNRRTLVRSRPSALAPMAGGRSDFSIVAGLRRGLKEFARAVGPHRAIRNAEPRVRSPQTQLTPVAPGVLPPPAAGFACGRRRPPGRPHLYSSRSSGSPSQWATTNVNGGAARSATRMECPASLSRLDPARTRTARPGKTVIGVCSAGRNGHRRVTSSGDPK
jgi:hypothetical protein